MTSRIFHAFNVSSIHILDIHSSLVLFQIVISKDPSTLDTFGQQMYQILAIVVCLVRLLLCRNLIQNNGKHLL